MFNPLAYSNSRPDGFGVLEVVGEEAAPQRFVPLQRSELRGEVVGPLASLSLTQVFGYTHEQCPEALEAVYGFPLPGDAAVTGVTVRFGEVEIVAQLKPREDAEADYQKAKRRGRQAALVTRESLDVFTVQVAGIQPDQDISVVTAYVQLARAEDCGWSLRVPLTTSPRYVRSDELTGRHAHGQPLALLRDPGHRFALDLTLAGAGAVRSLTHALDVLPVDGGLHVRLQGGEVLPDRDCVLAWQPAQAPDRPALAVHLHDDERGGQVYFLAQVAPPAARDAAPAMHRDVILLVDHSGSMEGAKWEAADWTVVKYLSELSEGDRFNLGLFHNATRWFADGPQTADVRTVERAAKFLRAHRDSGGTELGVALEQALSQPRARGEYARHVLVITDAQVGDEGRILRLAEEEARAPDRRRISVLCIDAAPNSFLASELAERGGGVARFLTSAPEEEDITTALEDVLADWAQPVLTGLSLEVDRPVVQAAGRATLAPGAIDLGDLPAGRTVWVAGRAPRGTGGGLAFRLTAADGREVAASCVSAAEGASRPGLKALFGAWRVLGLEFLIHSGRSGEALADRLLRLGYDPAHVLALPGRPRVYAENTREDAEKALRALLTQEALDYGLASSETAFVAVRKERGKVVRARAIVANALPSGWSDGFLTARASVAFSAMRMARPDSSLLADSAGLGMPAFRHRRSARRSAADFLRDSEQAEPLPFELYTGRPTAAAGEAVLFDTARAEDAGKLPEGLTLSRLRVRYPVAEPEPADLGLGLVLLIYVGDLAAPRAKVRLADLLRQGGERPLNVGRQAEERVRIVLQDPAGAWAAGAPEIEVSVA